MLDAFLNSLFGCSHRKTSFPLTPSRRTGLGASNYSGQKRNSTYVVCLDCGKEFDYDWKDMRVGEAVRGVNAAQGASVAVVD